MKAIRALMLVLAFSVCAYAGVMPNELTGNMPCERTGDMPCEKTGNMPNEKAGNMPCERTSAVDPVTEIALQLLQSVLPLF